MKICAYVQSGYAKANYTNECFNARVFAGMAVVIDILDRAGFPVDYAGSATVHEYDIVLVSITSDCDWWSFIAERLTWKAGSYKVIVGGAGCLNVRPFLSIVDYFVLGRAEGIIDNLVESIFRGKKFENNHVVAAKDFSPEKSYHINQVNDPYKHEITLPNGNKYKESRIGCNHKCFFCSYTWHRKNTGGSFCYDDLWAKNKNVEIAILDMESGNIEVDYNKLRTSAIDGMSERIRFMVNKKITRTMTREFIKNISVCEKPHQVKLYNILGYPKETENDWFELLEDIEHVDSNLPKDEKQSCILLHSTPFRAMPATPMSCSQMSYRNYRGAVACTLGKSLKGNISYQGNKIWAVESMGTESLSTVIMSAIMLRGTESDFKNIVGISKSKKFANASSSVKQKTLEKYFDVKTLFSAFDQSRLPTKYLKSYVKIGKSKK